MQPESAPAGTKAPRATASILVPAVLVVVLAAQVVLLLGFRTELQELQAQAVENHELLAAQEAQIQLLRIETGAEGLGVRAVIEHIETHVPELTRSSTPQPQRLRAQALLDRALKATEALGPGVFPAISAAIDDPEKDPKVREWLMKAALRADPARGTQLLSDYTRGRRGGGNGRLRILAGKLLVETDKRLAAEALHDVLTTESHLGVRRPTGNDPVAQVRPPVHDFFNFIDLYVQSEHDQVEVTLLSLLNRRDHNLITKQRCVSWLGEMQSSRAAPIIRSLFSEPPSLEPTPLFRQRCVNAIGRIEGPAACEWFRESLKTAESPPVRAALQAQLREHCN